MGSVKLAIYDLSHGLASEYSKTFLGKHIEAIWVSQHILLLPFLSFILTRRFISIQHTAIVIFGCEFYFGYNDGIAWSHPGKTPSGTPLQVTEYGRTERTRAEFKTFLRELSRGNFQRSNYSLFTNNCNTFTNACLRFLVKRQIPRHILALPKEALTSPAAAILREILNETIGPPPAGYR